MVEKLKALISELENALDQQAGTILRGQILPEEYKASTKLFNGTKALWEKLNEILKEQEEAE